VCAVCSGGGSESDIAGVLEHVASRCCSISRYKVVVIQGREGVFRWA
jgi:hypothetical protein